MEDNRPEGRRFWTVEDVTEWLTANAELAEGTDLVESAIWWCCYRDTEALVDDTVKHIAQYIKDGIMPYEKQNVTERVQDWLRQDEVEYPLDQKAIDSEIEEDLREFFLSGR